MSVAQIDLNTQAMPGKTWNERLVSERVSFDIASLPEIPSYVTAATGKSQVT
jgi:hypothetical protein